MTSGEIPAIINVDSLFQAYTLAEKEKALKSASDRLNTLTSDWKIKEMQM